MMHITRMLVAFLVLAMLGGCALFADPEADPRSQNDPQPWNSVPGWERQMGPGVQH